ncbi:diaminopimelate epimerase [Actinokineospora baliensis]|uniref:hypothetical protein n=1 Tax=Actinokineospora baliensis TaxID=547056 RepID=UPI00195BE663|nr:hypothetical protein [Actinokineospora baliensis]MBM7775494.1 diaminopimelate epimerase [Actinokineospora baliensis]
MNPAAGTASTSDVRVTVPFTKVYDSGRDFVVARGLRPGVRWGRVAPAVCSATRGIGASGLLVITGHRGRDFRISAYDAQGGRDRLGDSAIRCAARAIHHEYGVRHMRIGLSRYRYDVEVTDDAVDVLVHHQDVPTGPSRTAVEGVPGPLDFYGLRVGTEHLVAYVDDLAAVPDRVRGVGLARFTLAQPLDADTVLVRTFEQAGPVPTRSEDAVTAVAVAGYLGRLDRAAGAVCTPDGTRLRVRCPGGAVPSRVSGPGAVVYAGEFSWPLPSLR